jgi:hypothetical protein
MPGQGYAASDTEADQAHLVVDLLNPADNLAVAERDSRFAFDVGHEFVEHEVLLSPAPP